LAREADKAPRKRHHSSQDRHDGSRESDEEVEHDAASEGHHPKFNRHHPAGQDRSRTLHEELDRIMWQGEQVYSTPTHNALASLVIVDQLTPLLPKDSEEVNLQVKRLHQMLYTTTMMDPTLNLGVEKRCQDPGHCQSLRGNSASCISTFGLEHDQGWGEEDLRDVLRTKDACGWIKNRHQDRDRVECERHNERDYDFHGSYYD
jgi:hypothetical protein